MEREHGASPSSGKHAADLMVFALDQSHLGRALTERAQSGGGAGLLFAVEAERATGKNLREPRGQVAVEGGVVDFWDLVLRGGEAVGFQGG